MAEVDTVVIGNWVDVVPLASHFVVGLSSAVPKSPSGKTRLVPSFGHGLPFVSPIEWSILDLASSKVSPLALPRHF